MYWHMISFALLLTLQLLTSVNGDHKRVIVYVPHKIRVNHHKRTVTKQTGDGGDLNVIGFSGSPDFINKFAAEGYSNQGMQESYGGGHGKAWLQASAMQGTASLHGGNTGSDSGGFGPGYMEVDSFQGGYGHHANLADSFQGGYGHHANLVDNYFAGQNGFDTSYKYR